jgi:hypothetical protein
MAENEEDIDGGVKLFERVMLFEKHKKLISFPIREYITTINNIEIWYDELFLNNEVHIYIREVGNTSYTSIYTGILPQIVKQDSYIQQAIIKIIKNNERWAYVEI